MHYQQKFCNQQLFLYILYISKVFAPKCKINPYSTYTCTVNTQNMAAVLAKLGGSTAVPTGDCKLKIEPKLNIVGLHYSLVLCSLFNINIPIAIQRLARS